MTRVIQFNARRVGRSLATSIMWNRDLALGVNERLIKTSPATWLRSVDRAMVKLTGTNPGLSGRH
jgi:hypothetical protein